MSVAQRYAQALLLAAGDQAADTTELAGELEGAVALLGREADLRSFLEHPAVGVDAKHQVLGEVFAPRARQLTLNFMHLLLDKHRMRELPAIARAFRERVEEQLGRGEAQVQAARPLSEVEVERIAAALQRRTGKRVRLTADVRPDLIGGVRVVMGDRVFDGSVLGQLQRLGQRLAGEN